MVAVHFSGIRVVWFDVSVCRWGVLSVLGFGIFWGNFCVIGDKKKVEPKWYSCGIGFSLTYHLSSTTSASASAPGHRDMRDMSRNLGIVCMDSSV